MEGETRKRKRAGKEEEDDINEEEKMEKFFALMRSTREVRDLLMRNNPNKNTNNDDNNPKEGVEKKVVDVSLSQRDKPAAGVWNPTFQPEDFLEGVHDDEFHNINNHPRGTVINLAGPSKRGGGEENNKEGQDNNKDGGNDHLDLKLSL